LPTILPQFDPTTYSPLLSTSYFRSNIFFLNNRHFDMRSCGQVSEFRNDNIVCGITAVSFSKSGRILFSGYDDYNCLGWDVLGPTDKHLYQLQGHEIRVSCLEVAPDGNALCTGSWDNLLKIWA
jgi:guanine nucleotide-binding protein G(I)/G(S)/G(T) subunit beta-1